MRPPAALLVLCATLLACTPAAATWTGSAEQTVSMEVLAGNCASGDNCDTSAGTCNTTGNPPTCAKAKAAATTSSVMVKMEVISATASCSLAWSPAGQTWIEAYTYAKYDCNTGGGEQWYSLTTSCFNTTSAFVPANSSWQLWASYTLSSSNQNLLEDPTSGCSQFTFPPGSTGDRLSLSPCSGPTMFSHFRPGYNTTSGDLVAELKKICPSPSTTPAPSPPAPLAKAPTDTKHFVEMAVTMPYTVEQFNTDAVKTSFKKAVASAAGTVPDNVVIVSVKSASRRNSGVVVQTKILAKDAAAVTTMKSTLGSGAALKTKLNAALKSEGLKESTGVTAPVTGTFAAAGSTASPTKWLIAALSLAAFACT